MSSDPEQDHRQPGLILWQVEAGLPEASRWFERQGLWGAGERRQVPCLGSGPRVGTLYFSGGSNKGGSVPWHILETHPLETAFSLFLSAGLFSKCCEGTGLLGWLCLGNSGVSNEKYSDPVLLRAFTTVMKSG